jgi:hypothetical protein
VRLYWLYWYISTNIDAEGMLKQAGARAAAEEVWVAGYVERESLDERKGLRLMP